MLTIFAIPKPFQGHFDIIQRNAILSWSLLEPKSEIILLGNEEGIAEVAKELNLGHIPEVARNEFGTPLLSDMFSLVQRAARGEILAMLNPDIILMNDFPRTIKLLQRIQKGPFLMVGQRWNLNFKEPFQFNRADWEQKLRERIRKEGKMLGPSGMDYLVFPHSLEFNPPSEFTMGRAGVDNWLVYWAKSQKIPVIDATKVIDIVHQNHDYPQKRKSSYKIENQRNIKAIGGFSKLATLRDADWLLTKEGLRKPPFLRMVFSKLTLFYPWRTLLGLKRRIQNII